MIVENNKVVSIHYHLTDETGEVIDSNVGQGPLPYLHGASNIIPGLENALTGLGKGDMKRVVVNPGEGYGEYDENLIFTVPLDQVENRGEGIEPGMILQSSEGHDLMVTGIDDENISLDANHPLAGKTLNFDVTISDIREASEEELSHGHPHGEGSGHNH